MKKNQINKKLIIDSSLFLLLIIGAIMHINSIPGAIILMAFGSCIWSILILFGIFYLFKTKKYKTNPIWCIIIGILISPIPISYFIQIFELPGWKLFFTYSGIVQPIFTILFFVIYLIKKDNSKPFYFNMLIRFILLTILSWISMMFSMPNL